MIDRLLRELGAGWTRSGEWIGVSDRWIVRVADGRAEVRDTGDRRDVRLVRWIRDDAELDRALPTLVERARWWAGRLTVFRLRPGRTYRVLRPFTDCHGQPIPAGDWTFRRRDYLPYHGGTTLHGEPFSIWLQDEDNAELLADFDLYFG